MEVSLIACTEDPISVISFSAGASYGKDDFSYARVQRCAANGHMGVFEHASFTVSIKGISRACSHQLVRHRLASFVQKSQRYTKIDTDNADWYVKPPSFCNAEKFFDDAMAWYASNYVFALNAGIPAEDARFLLPEATKTDIIMTMNAREFAHFWHLRSDKNAQWEIRELATKIRELFDVQLQTGWSEIMGMICDARCE